MVNTSSAYMGVIPEIPVIPLQDIVKLPPDQWNNLLNNDFEKSVFAMFPEISDIKKTLIQKGAVYASLTGSGSAVFGLFRQIPENLKSLFPGDYFIYSDTRL